MDINQLCWEPHVEETSEGIMIHFTWEHSSAPAVQAFVKGLESSPLGLFIHRLSRVPNISDTLSLFHDDVRVTQHIFEAPSETNIENLFFSCERDLLYHFCKWEEQIQEHGYMIDTAIPNLDLTTISVGDSEQENFDLNIGIAIDMCKKVVAFLGSK